MLKVNSFLKRKVMKKDERFFDTTDGNSIRHRCDAPFIGCATIRL